MNRIVRTESYISKLKAYPFDTYLYLNEIRLSIDWDSYADPIALPTATLLNITFFILTSIRQLNSDVTPSNDLFRSGNYKRVRSRALHGVETPKNNEYSVFAVWSWFSNLMLILLLGICIINVFHALFAYRKYTFLNRKSSVIPNTPSAYKVKVEAEDSSFQKVLYQLHYSRFFRKVDETRDDDFGANGDNNEFWQLSVWNPSKFSLYFMIPFNPVGLIIFTFIGASFKNFLIVSLINLFLYFIIAQRYMVLMKDKDLIHRETFNEYVTKFVNPKLSVPKMDASIDATHGPNYGSMNYHTPFLREKVFVVHDLNGVPIDTMEKPVSNFPFSRAFSNSPMKPRLADSLPFSFTNQNGINQPTPKRLTSPIRRQRDLEEENHRLLSSPFRRSSPIKKVPIMPTVTTRRPQESPLVSKIREPPTTPKRPWR